MKRRNPYDERENAYYRSLSALNCTAPSPVKQAERDNADINSLVRRFGLDKAPPPPAVFDPSYYGQVDDIYDLRTALDRVRDAETRFMALPHQVRKRFDNSPATLWAWVNDPANREEAIAMGLLSGARGQGATNGAPASPDSPPAPSAPVAAS